MPTAPSNYIDLARAVQVDPGFPQLTPRLLSGTFRDFQLLKLKHDTMLSHFAIKCNLRHYSVVEFAKLTPEKLLLQTEKAIGNAVGCCRLTPG